jgi:hypothetical protein
MRIEPVIADLQARSLALQSVRVIADNEFLANMAEVVIRRADSSAWVWREGDYSAQLAADTGNLLYRAGHNNPTADEGVFELASNTQTVNTANVSGTVALSLLPDIHDLTVTGNVTINVTAPGIPRSSLIHLAQDATGGRTMTINNVVWLGGSTPSLSDSAEAVNVIALWSIDGTTVYGSLNGIG